MRYQLFVNPLFWGTVAGILLSTLGVRLGFRWYSLNLSEFLTIEGTVITAVAFGFGTYFAVLAIDAYVHVASLRDAAQRAEIASSEADAASKELALAVSTAKQASMRIETDAFSRLEGVMTAICEYVQKIPSEDDNHRRAVKELVESVSAIRSTYIYQKSESKDEVMSAVLDIAMRKIPGHQKIFDSVLARFGDQPDVCACVKAAKVQIATS
jgi:hypothetical protein